MAAPLARGKRPQGKKSFQRRRQPDADARAAVRAKKAYHHVKLLQKALKKAKQFEVQKVTRRQKDGGLEPAAAQKLALQLEAVKQLDLTDLSQQAGAQYGLVPDPKPGKVQPDAGAAASSLPSALSLMAARLLAAKCVRDAGQAAVKDLQLLDAAAAAAAAKAAAAETAAAEAAAAAAAAGAEPAGADGGLGRAGTAAAERVEQGLGKTAAAEGDVENSGARVSKRRKLADDGAPGSGLDSDLNPGASPAGSQGTAAGYSSEELEGFAGAGDSDSDSGGAHASDDDVDNDSEVSMSDDEGNNDTLQQRKRALLLLGPGPAPDPAVDPAPDPGVGPGSGPSVKAAQPADVDAKGSKKRARGTEGGAEAAAAAGKVGAAGKAPAKKQKVEKKPKNRLGQRARRKMAEEQFGAAARHVAEPPLPPPPPPPGSRAAGHAAGGGGAAGGGDAAEALHPSWAAKRQQKGMLVAQPQGTRVVFGEDGAVEKAVPAAAAAAGSGAVPSSGAPRRGPHPDEGSARRRAAAPGPPAAARDGNAPKPAAAQPEVLVKDRVRFREKPAAAPKPLGGRGGGRGAAGGRGPVHPSWEAKKLLRIRMEHLPKPEGSKVVFEDSD